MFVYTQDWPLEPGRGLYNQQQPWMWGKISDDRISTFLIQKGIHSIEQMGKIFTNLTYTTITFFKLQSLNQITMKWPSFNFNYIHWHQHIHHSDHIEKLQFDSYFWMSFENKLMFKMYLDLYVSFNSISMILL